MVNVVFVLKGLYNQRVGTDLEQMKKFEKSLLNKKIDNKMFYLKKKVTAAAPASTVAKIADAAGGSSSLPNDGVAVLTNSAVNAGSGSSAAPKVVPDVQAVAST